MKSKVIKKPGDEDGILTDWQAEEWVKCSRSVEYFMESYVIVQNPAMGGAVNFTPRDYQRDFINLIANNNFAITCLPRQVGKSITVTAYLLWATVFKSDTKVGISAHVMSGAKEIMARLRYAYENLPWWLKPAVRQYNVYTVEFDNGSSLEAGATTEQGLRGKSFSILYLDEFAHVKPLIAEAFWTSLLPTITGGGDRSRAKVIITSTPNGTEGLYAQLWFGAISGDNGFVHFTVDPSTIEGRDEAFKQKMLKKMSETKYRQEFECAFLSSKETLISSMVLESIKKRDPTIYMDEQTYFWESPKGKKLAVSCDVGTGVGADYHVIEIFDIDTLTQVGEFRNNVMPQTEFTKHLLKVLKYLLDNGAEEIYYSVEGNSYGIGIINLLDNTSSPVVNHPKVNFVQSYGTKQRGIYMSPKSKKEGCAKFKDLVEGFKMTLRSEKLISELKFFVRSGQTFKAESGMHDDLAMACVLLTLLLMEVSYNEDELHDKMNTVSFDVEGEDDYEEPTPFVI